MSILQSTKNKQYLVVGIIILLLTVGLLLIYYLSSSQRSGEVIETGGAGEPTEQTLLVVGWNKKDNYGVTVGEQAQTYEQQFISAQVLGDYVSHHPTKDMLVSAEIIEPIKRDTSLDTNSLSFTMKVGQETYDIVLTFGYERKTIIKNAQTSLNIEKMSVLD